MNWQQNQWGGWREAEHGLIVSQSPKKWWRVWVPGRDMPLPNVFVHAADAKAFAEAQLEGSK